MKIAIPILAVLATAGQAAGASSQARLEASLAEAAQRLRAYELQEVAVPVNGGSSELLFVEAGGVPMALDLRPHSLLARDFRLLVQTERGIEEHPVPPTSTYRGTVVDVPGSAVYASIDRGGLHARILLPWQQELWIQPVDENPTGLASALHLVYDQRDVVPGNETCGAGGTPSVRDGAVVPPELQLPAPLPDAECYAVTDIAFDADFEYYQANGWSVTNTMNDIVGLMNSVEALFRDNMEITYEIGTILVRSTDGDPYASTGAGCGAEYGMLDEFQDEWNANQGAIVRDVAALMTGKNLVGTTIGCAYVGVVCNTGGAYSINEARFTTNFSLRVALVAHELGHNWGASHCDGDPLGCAIMCSTIGGCGGIVSVFAPTPDITMSSFRAAATCLSDVVHVDVAHTGPTCHGTSTLPYPTLGEGTSCSMSTWTGRRDVRVQAGHYAEGVLTIDRFVLVDPQGGVVSVD